VPTNSELPRLIPLIYDAAEDPTLWPDVLNQLAAALGAVGTVFTIDDLRRDKSNMTVAIGIDPAFQRLYNERYESLNLHLQRARPLLTPGRVMATHQLCSDQETLATEYYHEFLRPQEDRWFHIVGGCVAKEQYLLSVLSFMRGRRAGHFTDREMHLLESLMPHLRRAARLHQAFAMHKNVAACFDCLPSAALLVNDRGHINLANQAAREIVQSNDGIGADHYGNLTSTSKRVRELIAAVCRTVTGYGVSPGASILVLRPSGRRAYSMTVSPIRQCHPFSAERHPGAVVFIVDPEVQRAPITEIVASLYHLTAAEARIVALLVEGKDLNQICEELGIRRTTARTHLGRVRDKLGVRRQAELVSVVLRTIGLLPPGFEIR
jgi:DNA-binding CsgD family transcriptional regulator